MRARVLLILILAFTIVIGALAQDTDAPGTEFGLGLTLGTQSFPNPGGEPDPITWSTLGLTPDLALGNFGVGLDLTLNFQLDGDGFVVREEDWIPNEDTTFLELYLPKIRYVRWGLKGDPLYVLLGSIDNGLLGNGFIMGGYTNTQLLPTTRLFGLSLDVDGALFSFPYVGVETFVGNLAVFDVIGSRLFVRPLVATQLPIISNLQIGTTVVADRRPFQIAEDDPDLTIDTYLPAGQPQDEAQVVIWGADFRLPILTNPVISLAGFGDYVNQNGNSGGMLGAGGRLFGLMTYGGQLRFLGEDFIPVYFDRSYDLFRPEKYAVYAGVDGFTTDPYVGWFVSAGFSLLDDQVVFTANLDGPFGGAESDDKFKQPHLLASFVLAEGILGGFSFEGVYDKTGIEDFADLINPEDAVIEARINYQIENATISFIYDLQYDPGGGERPWVTTTRIESAITLF